MSDLSFIYVTTPNVEEGRRIAHALLEKKLIACANILPQMESLYRWQGKIESANEVVLILKTQTRLVDETIRAVEKLHSYDTPCALSFSIDRGSAKYMAWLEGEVR